MSEDQPQLHSLLPAMKSSAALTVNTHEFDDHTHEDSWAQLWRSPSSPPFQTNTAQFIQLLQNHDGGTDDHDSKPSSPPFQRAGVVNGVSSSSPSSHAVSEFEFDSVVVEGKDDPPVSPKLIAPSWKSATAKYNITVGGTTMIGESNNQSIKTTSKDKRGIARALDVTTDHHVEHRKTKSGVLNDHMRHPLELPPLITQRNKVQLASKSESRSHLKASVSSRSASSLSAYGVWDIKNGKAHQPDAMSKGRGSQKQLGGKPSGHGKRWAFKDFLRRTVASSKPHQNITSANYNGAAYTYNCNNRKVISSVSAPMSPASSPPRSPLEQYYDAVSTPRSPFTPRSNMTLYNTDGRPSTRTPSSYYSQPSTPSRSTTPRSPMSPHALHDYMYQQQHKDQLSRKTFLPYRQSLLGCLGLFPSSEQQVW